MDVQDHGLGKALDVSLIEKCQPAFAKGQTVKLLETARNVNRSVGAMLSGELVRHHPEGLPDDTIWIQMEGTGGQSFGAFLAKGICLYLIGEANDYTGKGLSGGRVVVRPSIDFRGRHPEHHRGQHGAVRCHQWRGLLPRRGRRTLCGAPVRCHGGRGRHGRPWLRVHDRWHRGGAGQDGPQLRRRYERWRGLCVRRGRHVCLALQHLDGDAGKGAHHSRAAGRGHPLHKGQTDEALLKALVEQQHRWTGSLRAREILDQWASARARFVKVFPPSTSAR